MDDSEALVAMKIYQQRHGGNLAEISILFANVVSALKQAAQPTLAPDACPVCHLAHSPNGVEGCGNSSCPSRAGKA